MRRFALVLMLLVAAGGCSKSSTTAEPSASASAAPTASTIATAVAVHTTTNTKLGTILVDASGKTLYFFDRDEGTTIACTDACATKWPPLLTTGTPTGATGLGTVKRPEGTTQVTYQSHPLYRYSGDAKAGDTTGDGFAGVWHAAKVT